ncbi:hypothetical protein BIY24_03825 [Halobacteriovorax marinus]|uniref:type IV toxin-antitoxin system AbiEi family antitoxin domain-containing protein n=1 Tax=Halobacteriovorax marinus TaxID=97084 RepID=UPI000BC326B0|nr:type IV toxin-antitoxin system AbiEi family antitoxin domain-containing protein [Halobacteriovorax marinus]ATH07095.1 hypothetical protein BIY24_03825 [Halobacteriovorax marinus]
MSENKIKELRDIIGNRSFQTKEALEQGVSSRMLSFYTDRGDIERIGRGLYIFSDYDVEVDYEFHELVLTAKSIKDSVICLISALSYWDITDEIQKDYWLAIPNNHPIPKGRKRTKFIRPRDLVTGVISKNIAGVKVKITTPERSVCDAFKYLDEEAAITSLRSYMSQEKANIPELLNTAKSLKVKKVLEIMREIAEASGKDYPTIDRDKFRDYVSWLTDQKENTK